ncbi:hypothetical protein D7V97_12350 [Corallococcus sp. CA053C]|uniref:hypothetical protein n=1 Tax=Corallococcus sp. CA053C TaxID=2316732 RepID=UPI000EA01323|nr:hypothetical protein [Corallococcus sp. CA053C]RKH11001.1 hypothetical protein D7V97_12350 [Corallococcus sp. CA053C]
MNKFARVVCLGSALVVSACGGPEQMEGEAIAQQEAAFVIPSTASSQGCSFTLNATQITTAPPSWNITLTRTGGASCAYPTGDSVVLGTSNGSEPKVSLAGNALGLAAAFTMKGTFSGSSPIALGLRHVDPTNLTTVRSADIRGDYPYGQITSGGVSIQADGTTLKVSGSKSGTLQGMGGTYYTATFLDFFTSTTAPTYQTF